MKDLKVRLIEDGKAAIVCCVSQLQATWVSNPHNLSLLYSIIKKENPKVRNIYISYSPVLYKADDLNIDLISLKKQNR